MPKRKRIGEEMVLAPGQVLRGERTYRVLEYLGRGGFAAGYRVLDDRGEERFLKELLPPGDPRDRRERERLYKQERGILAQISGYELCPTLHDAFVVEGLRYLILDYIAGDDLERRLAARQRAGEHRLLRWSVCLCSILAHLHSRQIVHHDLKPANIRINPDDDPVIIDFGAARRLHASPDAATESYGTEGYLPPELAAGETGAPLEARQRDVFALGRVIVEMMVGARLTQEEIFARKESLYGELLHSRTLPPEFARAVFRALSYDPAHRYPSAREMLADLLGIAPPVGRVRTRRLDFGVVAGDQPRRLELVCYNVGGGVLEGDVTTDCPWLEVNVLGGSSIHASRFRRNHQVMTVTAYPNRIRTRGLPVEGRLHVRFPADSVIVTCRLEKEGGVAQVTPSAARLRLRDAGDGWWDGQLTFRNAGSRSALVRWTIPGGVGTVAPDQALLDEGDEATVSLALEGRFLQDGGNQLPLEWHVNGDSQPPIVLEADVRSARRRSLSLAFARRALKG